jgi:hypothetical protein
VPQRTPRDARYRLFHAINEFHTEAFLLALVPCRGFQNIGVSRGVKRTGFTQA